MKLQVNDGGGLIAAATECAAQPSDRVRVIIDRGTVDVVNVLVTTAAKPLRGAQRTGRWTEPAATVACDGVEYVVLRHAAGEDETVKMRELWAETEARQFAFDGAAYVMLELAQVQPRAAVSAQAIVCVLAEEPTWWLFKPLAVLEPGWTQAKGHWLYEAESTPELIAAGVVEAGGTAYTRDKRVTELEFCSMLDETEVAAVPRRKDVFSLAAEERKTLDARFDAFVADERDATLAARLAARDAALAALPVAPSAARPAAAAEAKAAPKAKKEPKMKVGKAAKAAKKAKAPPVKREREDLAEHLAAAPFLAVSTKTQPGKAWAGRGSARFVLLHCDHAAGAATVLRAVVERGSATWFAAAAEGVESVLLPLPPNAAPAPLSGDDVAAVASPVLGDGAADGVFVVATARLEASLAKKAAAGRPPASKPLKKAKAEEASDDSHSGSDSTSDDDDDDDDDATSASDDDDDDDDDSESETDASPAPQPKSNKLSLKIKAKAPAASSGNNGTPSVLPVRCGTLAPIGVRRWTPVVPPTMPAPVFAVMSDAGVAPPTTCVAASTFKTQSAAGPPGADDVESEEEEEAEAEAPTEAQSHENFLADLLGSVEAARTTQQTNRSPLPK
jgi:hypothetical protein